MNLNWKKLLGDHPPILLPGWERHKVYISIPTRDNIYDQLLKLKGNRVIELVPGDREDWERYKERTNLPEPYTNWTPEEHCASRKVGSLVDVAKNIPGYLSPLNEIYAMISIDEKFKDFHWKAYSLYIGLDSDSIKYDYERGEDGWTPKDWKAGFVITECKVKGLYLEKNESHNNYDRDISLMNYYLLRGFGMYVYLPGISYL